MSEYNITTEKLLSLMKETKDMAIEMSENSQAVLVKNIENTFLHLYPDGTEDEIDLTNFYNAVYPIKKYLEEKSKNEGLKRHRKSIDDVVNFVPPPSDDKTPKWINFVSEPKRDEDFQVIIHELNELPKKVREYRPTTVENFWKCDRCNRTSDDNTEKNKFICPCPRGGCEAEVIGQKKTTVVIDYFVDEEEAQD